MLYFLIVLSIITFLMVAGEKEGNKSILYTVEFVASIASTVAIYLFK